MGSSRRTTAGDNVREEIKQYILDHRLAPGSPMPTELELCDELGVSRSSVREAMRQLNALDIVNVQHGHGTFVGAVSLAPLVDSVTFRCQMDQRDARQVLREILDVRKALDLGQMPEVVASLSNEPKPELHQLADEMVNKASIGSGFPDADRCFHTQLLAQTTGNTFAQNLIGAYWDIHARLVDQLGIPQPSDIIDTAAAHKQMLLAAESGDTTGYAAAVTAHYEPLLRVLERSTSHD